MFQGYCGCCSRILESACKWYPAQDQRSRFVRKEGKNLKIEEEFTTNDLDKTAIIMAAQREKRQAGAIAAKVLQRATLEAAATPSEVPKNEQQVRLRKVRVRQLHASIAAAEKRKAQLHGEYPQCINSWGGSYTERSGNTHIVKKAGIMSGSAPIRQKTRLEVLRLKD